MSLTTQTDRLGWALVLVIFALPVAQIILYLAGYPVTISEHAAIVALILSLAIGAIRAATTLRQIRPAIDRDNRAGGAAFMGSVFLVLVWYIPMDGSLRNIVARDFCVISAALLAPAALLVRYRNPAS